MNIDYSQFYRGRTDINTYGNGTYKKDTLIKYAFNTTDENGNKIMDKMSREETLKALKDISNQYEENVIVEFSGEGLAALVESKKGQLEQLSTPEEQAEKIAKQAAFENEIVHLDNAPLYIPEYSGIYSADKAIASGIENSSKEEQLFVYDIIRSNFLISDSSSLTEEERQANISLGMKKAEYAAEHFIPEEQRELFIDAMKTIAKLAAAGKKNEDGSMDYGISKANYLGQGSNLVYTTDSLDMMKQMDSKAYAEYQRLRSTESDGDNPLNSLKFLTNWYIKTVTSNKDIVKVYEGQTDTYLKEKINNQSISNAFDKVDVTSKAAFLKTLKEIGESSNAFTSLIQKEIANPFWMR